jgi:hydroxymethylpyrimidine pyrophosphatase-like HAD family hydrolase
MRSGHARGIGRAGIGRPLAALLSRYHAPNLNKRTFVDPLLRRLVVPPMAVAALGDMENDLAMFGKVGRSIAMGNANAEERQANYVTASNADDGFARTIERYILDYQENEGIT